MTATRQITEITEITQFTCKQDMSRWTRAHADTPGINWSVYPGPGGTMIVVEHEEDRSTFLASQPAETTQNESVAVAASAETVTAAPVSFLDFALV